VFLHDSSGPNQMTDGARPLDNARFFARLVQRIIHFLSIQTSSGRLYDVDTRLRPDGSSGLIVASLDNFRRYQRHDAWTWEHQALLRSRAVAGSDSVCRAFEADRVDVLVNHVDRSDLKAEVSKMRARMRAELSKSKAGQFDLKQDPGGLADIEFLIDYWVLADSHEHPELVEFPDNVRQLDALVRAGLISETEAGSLKADYLALRKRQHELALNDADRVVDDSEFEELRARIVARWDATFA
jgi:glutamate-ammonia-ligase adenylyltransferase